jgi:hypothetical protein
MKFRKLESLRMQRQLAMDRARWCRDMGVANYDVDVAIARRFNRLLLRVAK